VSFIYQKLKTRIINNTNEFEHQLILYGVLGVLGFLFFYFFNNHFFKSGMYENIPLRFIAGILSFLLVLKNHWPHRLKNFVPFYWHLTLLFNLPFFFTFMLLKNPTDPLWPLHAAFALMLLILLVDWLTFMLICTIGISLGTAAYILTTPVPQIPDNFAGILSVYLSIIVYCSVYSQKNSTAYQEKLAATKMLAGAIAHELRTPLAVISMMSTNLKKSLTRLSLSKEKQGTTEIDPFLLSAPERLSTTAKNAFTIIDMVLMNLKDVSDQDANKVLSINHCIQETLNDYPLTEKETCLIHFIPGNDFQFRGDETLFKHVLFNLLKNALYYVKAAGKGEITITLKTGSNENQLIFKDTGKGMPSSMVSHVFDRFYSRTKHGTGIGLAFCKSVMSKFKGYIRCESIEGEHTTFILSFPVVAEDKKARAA
jgi:signal transduction histidine kinase